MATKAILNRRGATRSLAVAAHESAAAEQQGLTVEHRLPQGMLVSGDETQYAALKGTQQKGSYNVVVTVQGTSPVSNKRFVRRELFSLLAR